MGGSSTLRVPSYELVTSKIKDLLVCVRWWRKGGGTERPGHTSTHTVTASPKRPTNSRATPPRTTLAPPGAYITPLPTSTVHAGQQGLDHLLTRNPTALTQRPPARRR